MNETQKCAACEGVAHQATGCQYTATMLVCGPCVRTFWAWAQVHTAQKRRVGPKPSKNWVSFYEAATKSFAA